MCLIVNHKSTLKSYTNDKKDPIKSSKTNVNTYITLFTLDTLYTSLLVSYARYSISKNKYSMRIYYVYIFQTLFAKLKMFSFRISMPPRTISMPLEF